MQVYLENAIVCLSQSCFKLVRVIALFSENCTQPVCVCKSIIIKFGKSKDMVIFIDLCYTQYLQKEGGMQLLSRTPFILLDTR